MNTFSEKVNKLVETILSYCDFGTEEKTDFYKNITEGLVAVLITRANNVIPNEELTAINSEIEMNKNDLEKVRQTWQNFMQKLAEKEEGQKIIGEAVGELLNSMVSDIAVSLNNDQKEEVLKLLQEI